MDLERLRANLEGVRRRIDLARRRAGRPEGSVTLIVVTKSVPAEHLGRLLELGVRDIGENRAVEGQARVGKLSAFRRHLIGHLQTNKVKKALGWADVIHSLDRPALEDELRRHPRRPPVYLQVNVSGEASKGGYRPEEAQSALERVRGFLDVQGLMTMAPEGPGARVHFRRLRELGGELGLPGLSMGMSGDFEEAVEEGATAVRIGSAIFEGVLL
jgi:pyridoxal phosphate enzyme (YggS family)